jgi:hypothetical protein
LEPPPKRNQFSSHATRGVKTAPRKTLGKPHPNDNRDEIARAQGNLVSCTERPSAANAIDAHIARTQFGQIHGFGDQEQSAFHRRPGRRNSRRYGHGSETVLDSEYTHSRKKRQLCGLPFGKAFLDHEGNML